MKRPVTLITFSCVLLLSGCGTDEFEDLKDFVNTAGKGMRGKVEPPPVVTTYEAFDYKNPDGLPDPFIPTKPQAPGPSDNKGGGKTGGSAPPPHPHEELEDYPLESLRMKGYVNYKGRAHAIIESPDHKIHTVKVGNYVGQNFGKISEITETEVKLKEQVQDSSGSWSERISTLQLLEE